MLHHEKPKETKREAERKSAEIKNKMKRFLPFIGEWRGQGLSFGGKGQTQGESTTAKDTFEWLEGEFFVIHKWQWSHDNKVAFEGLEVFGWDDDNKEYFATMYDNVGHRVSYKLTEQNGIWNYEGEMQKAKLILSVDGRKLMSHWEASQDGVKFNPLCEIEWNKIT